MKNLLLTCFVLLSFAISHRVSAQEDRNKLEMTLTYKGMTDVNKVYNVSYYLTRPAPIAKNDTAKKGMGSTYDEEYFYLSVSLDTMSTKLLQMIADPQARVNGTITMKDNYSGRLLKEIKFYDAQLNNFSENLSTYSYGGSGGGTSVSVVATRLNVNGVELKTK